MFSLLLCFKKNPQKQKLKLIKHIQGNMVKLRIILKSSYVHGKVLKLRFREKKGILWLQWELHDV